MDAFFAQIEERENPQFKGKPVVVGADPKEGKGRGVVSTANYEARKYGLHSALPISQAFKLCPQAIFLPVNMALYQKVSERIMDIIKNYSLKYQPLSLDEAFLDISFAGTYQKAKDLGQKIKKDILKQEKLTCTVGLGPNKLIAKMATNKGKPNGLLAITPAKVKSFLEPLDIEELPGIGPKTAGRLREIGINKIKELKRASKTKLKDMFGRVGESIYDKARGVNEDEVSPEEVIKSIGKEHTFEKDTRDPEVIFNKFDEIIRVVFRELFENSFSCRTITVVCRFQGFETHTKSKTLKIATRDFEVLKKEAKKLLLQFLIENPKLIRLIGVRVAIAQAN